MSLFDFLRLRRRRQATADVPIDLSTPEARDTYRQALANKEAAFQAAREPVNFSRHQAPPIIRYRGSGDPPPLFMLQRARMTTRRRPSGLPDLVD